MSGSLERNVVVGLEAENNTAIRKLHWYSNTDIKKDVTGTDLLVKDKCCHEVNFDYRTFIVPQHLNEYYTLVFTEGVDFIGPDPSILTFISGQSAGDIQCADVTILDNSILEGERSFSVELREVPSERSVKINETMMSVDVKIDIDPNDSKFVTSCTV